MSDAALADARAADAAGGPCGTLTTFADGKTPSIILHVAPPPLGSDSGGDGSAARPFETIRRAVMGIQPGSAVRIHAGTYDGGDFLDRVQGTAAAPIWIGGAPGEPRPVLAGGGEGLHIGRARFLVVHDLEVRNTVANGLNFDDGSDFANDQASGFVVLRDLFVHDIGTGGNQDCLKLSGLNDFWVLGSELTKCGGTQGSGIDLVGCHRGVIARNHIHDVEGAVQTKGGAQDISIQWNRLLRAGARAVNMGGATDYRFFRPPLVAGTEVFEAKDIRVVANLITEPEAPFAFVGCDACLAEHNTVIDPKRYLLRILQENFSSTYTFVPARQGIVRGNLFFFQRSAIVEDVNVGFGVMDGTFQFIDNLWYAHDMPMKSAPRLPMMAVESGSLAGTDPGLTTNYHVPAGAPAAGRVSGVARVAGDLDGACWKSPAAAGAYESR